jgi:cyanophycinase-like exopeptidase
MMIEQNHIPTAFGPIVLFGSGETSSSGQRIFDQLFRQLPEKPRVSLLETPAGFELNSPQVANRVADFFHHRLQNFHPQIDIIAARKRGTPFSPNDAQIAAPLLKADLIFAGPGSPTYAVRQLQNSLTWHYLIARHRLGGALAFSSAAVIALGAHVLPIYEIYKVGQDPHWKPGLDFFAPYSLPLVFIPHWNNKDGGDELDTSRCFLGQARFEPMLEMLPGNRIVIGIDEHTALWIDCADQCCQVMGLGTITIIKDGEQRVISSGDSFHLNDLMDCGFPDPAEGIPRDIWELARNVAKSGSDGDPEPPQEVLVLTKQRQFARDRKDWAAADNFRDQIAVLGWSVMDTPEGPVISKQ